jgi:hypothetical protein
MLQIVRSALGTRTDAQQEASRTTDLVLSHVPAQSATTPAISATHEQS